MVELINEREQLILNILFSQGSVNVSELSEQLHVSEVTIRSDLSNLEKDGWLARTHGGAVSISNPLVYQKKKVHVDEKNAIAKKAASMVESGDTIMIEAGTTIGLIPRFLLGKRDIHIITNSNEVFSVTKNNPSIKITLVGGEFRRTTDSFVGPLAEETLRKFNVEKAFVGTDGFNVHSGITTHLVEGGEIIKIMRAQAQKLILLADSSKYNKLGVVNILPITDIDVIITNKDKNTHTFDELTEAGVQTIICE